MIPFALVIAAGAGAMVVGLRALARTERHDDASAAPARGCLDTLRDRLDVAELRFRALEDVQNEAELRELLATSRDRTHAMPPWPEPGAAVAGGSEPAPLTEGRYWRVDYASGPAPLVDGGTRALLIELGRRFHERLVENGLPLYRFTLASPPRETRRARGGGTAMARQAVAPVAVLDVGYDDFEYLPRPQEALPGAAPDDGELDDMRIGAYRKMGMIHALRLGRVLADVLCEFQDEGRLTLNVPRERRVCRVLIPIDDGTTAAAG